MNRCEELFEELEEARLRRRIWCLMIAIIMFAVVVGVIGYEQQLAAHGRFWLPRTLLWVSVPGMMFTGWYAFKGRAEW